MFNINSKSKREPSPVFIIGTGRCGSSMLTRVFSSNRELIVYPDEANQLWHPNSYPFSKKKIDTPSYHENPVKFTHLSLASWAQNHERKIKNHFFDFYAKSGGKKPLIIKSAMISFMIPKLIELWPDSRFIHIFRYGPSVIESFLIKEWKKYETYFNNEMEYLINCANYWNFVIIEIENQKKTFKLTEERLYELSYERFCEQPKELTRRMSEFLGVSSKRFKYDLSQIKSTNFKAEFFHHDPSRLSLLKMMEKGLMGKGYPIEPKECTL